MPTPRHERKPSLDSEIGEIKSRIEAHRARKAAAQALVADATKVPVPLPKSSLV